MKEDAKSFEAVAKSYIIDRTLMFIPNESFIQNVETSESKKLKHTESRCLLLLLARQGLVVSQLDLMKFAWGDKHRDVSFNIFYQRVLALRKSFIQLGLTKNIIITMPRRGLMIDHGVLVEIQDEITSTPEIAGVNEEKHPDRTLSIEPQPPAPAPALKLFNLILNRYVVITLILTTVMVSIFIFRFDNDQNYFSDYHLASNNDSQCQYFFNTDTNGNSRNQQFINQHPELCRTKKALYVTSYNNTKNLSLLICSAPISRTKENRCLSFYYPDYQTK